MEKACRDGARRASPLRLMPPRSRLGFRPAPPLRGAFLRALVTTAALALGLCGAGPAQAQATSWLYLGGGAGVVDRGDTDTKPLIQLDTGLGTHARSNLVWGGLLRMQAFAGGGVDLGITSRVVSGGYARGDFGAGLDLGVVQRWWGRSATGATASAVLGSPWGLSLSVGGTLAQGGQRTLFLSLGIDFARLTVHRHTGLSWMPNPMRSPGDEPR